MTVIDFSRQIGQLKRDRKYPEALAYFKTNKANFTKEQISNNEFLMADMLTCLRQTSNIEAGFKFLDLYGVMINENTKERILGSYGWLLWAQYKAENQLHQTAAEDEYQFEDEEIGEDIQNFHYSKSILLKKIEEVIKLLLKYSNEFNQTLISNLLSIVLKTEKRKAAPNWNLINDFCDQFDPEQFSRGCDTIQVERKGKLMDMELASDFENWFAYKSKALMKLGQWQKCFDTSKKALEKIENFHYSNDVWFSRRVALSKKNLGNTDETIQELQSILRKKKEWFIQKELAELYLEKGEIDKAFKFSIDAIDNFGPLEFKVDLLYLMGKIHQKKNESELAFKHFSLAKLIRLEEEWKIPQKLSEELLTCQDPEIPVSQIKELKRDLNRYWKSFTHEKPSVIKKTDQLKGKVARILNDNERGKDGFLESQGKEYYFTTSSNFHLTPALKEGVMISFMTTPDPKGKGERARITKINT